MNCVSVPTPGKNKLLFLWFSYSWTLFFAAPCTQGSIRLQGGTATSGRVRAHALEVCVYPAKSTYRNSPNCKSAVIILPDLPLETLSI